MVGIGIIEKWSMLRKLNDTRFWGFLGGITRFITSLVHYDTPST